GLWNFADDEGRFKAHNNLLKAQIFPYEKKINIDSLKKELNHKIQWYEVEGLQYGLIRNFNKYQRIDRPTESKLPPPPPLDEPSTNTPRTLVPNISKDNISKDKGSADEIYDYYAKTIKAGAKEDAIKSISKLLKAKITKEDLLGRINAYKVQLIAKPTDFIIQANNFFGEKARYKDFEPKKEAKFKPADKNCKLCKGTGFVYIPEISGNKICDCRKIK
ncbi:MAG: hypothetical protein NTZ48_06305, partial [Candidatus Omnitrophica bacterium]|nr:hypothetical protein [Candidatus Omnitrophota bacterium]